MERKGEAATFTVTNERHEWPEGQLAEAVEVRLDERAARTKAMKEDISHLLSEIEYLAEKMRYQSARSRWIHFQLERQADKEGK